jgi:hypothetical protein
MADDLVVQELFTEIDLYRWICIHALAERDDALWEIERINGRAQVDQERWGHGNLLKTLADIRAMCARALAGSKRIKEDE